MLRCGILAAVYHVADCLEFKEWLKGLDIFIPHKLSVTEYLPSLLPNIELSITQAECHSISLEDVAIDSTGSSHTFGVGLQLKGLGFKCKLAAVATTELPIPIGTGELDLDVTLRPSSLGFNFGLGLDDNSGAFPANLPTTLEVTGCKLPLDLDIKVHAKRPVEKLLAAAVDAALAFLMKPERVSGLVCDVAQSALFASTVGQALLELSQNLTNSGVFEPAVPLAEVDVDPWGWRPSVNATNMHELMQTGAVGHVFHGILHDADVTGLDAQDIDLGQVDISHVFKQLQEIAQAQLGVPDNLKYLASNYKNGVLQTSAVLPHELGSVDLIVPRPSCSNITGLRLGAVDLNATDHAVHLKAGLHEGIGGSCNVGAAMSLKLPQSIATAGHLDIDISALVGIHELGIQCGARVGINGHKAMYDLASDQITHLGCLAKILDSADPVSLALLDLGGSFKTLDLKLSSSDPLLKGVFDGVNSVANAFLLAFKPVIDKLLMGQGMDMARDSANEMIVKMFKNGASLPSCPNSVFKEPVPEIFVKASATSAGAFLLLAALAGAFVSAVAVKRCLQSCEKGRPAHHAGSEDSWVEATGDEALLSLSLHSQQVMNRSWSGSLSSCSIQFGLVTMIFLVFLNVFGLQASVAMWVTDPNPEGGGPTVQHPHDVLDLTLMFQMQTVQDWGFWWLAWAVGLLAFVIPLVRIGVLFGCWHLPPTILRVEDRGSILEQMAMSNKVEIIPLFLLVFIVAGQSFAFKGHDQNNDTVQFVVGNSPRFAFFMPLFLVVLGQWIVDVMVAAHHRGLGQGKGKQGLEVPASLLSEQRVSELPRARLCSQTSSKMALLVWPMLVAAPLLIICGSFITTWSATWGGLIGLIKWEFESTAVDHWSIAAMLSKFPLPDGTQADNFAVLCETVMFLLGMLWLLVLGPVLQCVTLVVLWTGNLTQERRAKLASLAQGLWRWQVLEIFVFMAGLACICHHYLSLYINEMFSTISALAEVCQQIDVVSLPCVSYELKPGPGLWILIVAVLAQIGATFLINHEVRRLSDVPEVPLAV